MTAQFVTEGLLKTLQRFGYAHRSSVLEQNLAPPSSLDATFELLATWSDWQDFSDFLESMPRWREALAAPAALLLDEDAASAYLATVGLTLATLVLDARDPRGLDELEQRGFAIGAPPSMSQALDELHRMYADRDVRDAITALLTNIETLVSIGELLQKRSSLFAERLRHAVAVGRRREEDVGEWSATSRAWCERHRVSYAPLPLAASGAFGFPLVMGLLAGGVRFGT